MDNQNVSSLSRTDWFNLGRWKQPVLSGAFWSHAHEAKSVAEVIPDRAFHPILFLDGYSLSHVADEAWCRDYAAQLIDEPEEAQALYERLEAAANEAEQEHRTLLNSKALSNEAYLAELFRTYNEMTGVWWFPIVISMALEEVAFARGLAADDEAMRRRIAPHHRATLLEEQSQEIHALADSVRERFPGVPSNELTKGMIQKDDALRGSIEEHVSRFAWFGTHHWEGDGYTFEKCVNDIRDVLAAGPAHPEPVKEKPAAGSYEHVWRLIAQFAYWRTHAAEATAEVVFRSRGRLTEVAEAWGLSYEDLTYFSAREILERLKSGEGPDVPKDFASRKAAYGCIVEGEDERIITGPELMASIAAVIEKTDTSVREFKGVVASKGGVVTGIARVILEPSEFSRFMEGDILVANETTPDFVPLMKKASAIVTDTGGITSHAAIVSRELKKPCVIGTKIATQVLTDGERIEVDATTGIVRKLG